MSCDFNGDGIDDLILSGVTEATSNGAYSGKVYVVFGQSGGLPDNFNLSAINGTNGIEILGPAANSYSGGNIDCGGDVNGDGIDDLIISSPITYAGMGSQTEGAYVIFGSNSGLPATIDMNQLNGTNGFSMTDGTGTDEALGYDVDASSDINGDGLNDIIVSEPGYNYSLGKTYVLFGKNSAFSSSIDLTTLNGTNGFSIIGDSQAPGGSGADISHAGDLNGDGVDDILISTPFASTNNLTLNGNVHVVFGNSGGFSAALDLGDLDGSDGFLIEGDSDYGYAGLSIAAAGDVNGDGVDDIILGAPYAANYTGEAFVLFGKSTGFNATFPLSSIDGTNGFKIVGKSFDDYFGTSVDGAGDVNGDGIDDIAIGAYYASPFGTTEAGESYVIFGRNTGFPQNFPLTSLDGNTGFSVQGNINGGLSGYTIQIGGDFNEDGIDDLAIGAPAITGMSGTQEGKVYVLYGFTTVGIEEALAGVPLTTFPNPTNDVLRLRSEAFQTIQDISIEVLDIVGRTYPVNYTSTDMQTYELDTRRLPAGQYILKITADHELGYSRFIKQ